MKKRRLCTWDRFHSPRNSPRPIHEAFPIRSRSFHDSKHRRARGNSQSSRKIDGEIDAEFRIKGSAFGSLESLFDVKKPLVLPDIEPLNLEYREKGYASSPEISPRLPRKIVQSIINLKPDKLEPHLIKKTQVIDDFDFKEKSENTEEKFETNLKDSSNSTEVVINETSTPKMAEIEEGIEVGTEVIANGNDILPNGETAEATQETTQEPKQVPTQETIQEEAEQDEVPDTYEDADETREGDGKPEPPEYPMPPGAGEGIPIKPGGRADSVISATPLTDAEVMEEMKKADQRCAAISKEIAQLKRELDELTNKKDLSEEDTLQIQEKQENIMAKLAEFEKITRKLQRVLGLADPSSYTFAKMFDLLPYPHSKGKTVDDEQKKLEAGDDETKVITEIGKKFEHERFDVPRVEYPEDKLPRVIVCGYTEEDIPKIVVADAEHKGKKKCLRSLTGKLSESLTMQEKLVEENAKLEGGKYKLEEALLEKDTAVETLQRKVCGLQAEMRIVVKENTELSRQLACLNRRVGTSPTRCSACPGSTPCSVPVSCSPLPPCSCTSSSPREDYCRCKCCLQSRSADLSITNTLCVNPETLENAGGCGTPRLAGGASGVVSRCLISEFSSQTEEMCCRSPAVVKTPCPGRVEQRGACPAELEAKLATYGNTSEQLERQLGNMEGEIRNMQMELANVQRERQQLEQQRKLLKCTGPCAPCSCCPAPPCTLQPPSIPPSIPPVPPIGPRVPPTVLPTKVLSRPWHHYDRTIFSQPNEQRDNSIDRQNLRFKNYYERSRS